MQAGVATSTNCRLRRNSRRKCLHVAAMQLLVFPSQLLAMQSHTSLENWCHGICDCERERKANVHGGSNCMPQNSSRINPERNFVLALFGCVNRRSHVEIWYRVRQLCKAQLRPQAAPNQVPRRWRTSMVGCMLRFGIAYANSESLRPAAAPNQVSRRWRTSIHEAGVFCCVLLLPMAINVTVAVSIFRNQSVQNERK